MNRPSCGTPAAVAPSGAGVLRKAMNLVERWVSLAGGDRSTVFKVEVDGGQFVIKEIAERDRYTLANTKQRVERMMQLQCSDAEACPDLVQHYGLEQDSTRLKSFVLMELVEGRNLNVVARSGPVPEQELKRWVWHVLRSLAFLHRNGIVHRDVKGSNMVLSRGGLSVKLTDVGSVLQLSDPGRCTDDTKGEFSSEWMAPEVIDTVNQVGNATYGIKADIWSLGITVFELANGGNPPWRASADDRSHDRLRARIADPETRQPTLSHLSRAANHFISTCLKRVPSERWSATELLNHEWLATM